MVSRWFRISFAENALRRFAAETSVPLETLHAPDAVALALAFYRDRRAQHARVTDEGDGLLWQWGPDADAERFTIDLTRQLVREDEDAITQLCLTLAYRVSQLADGVRLLALRALVDGDARELHMVAERPVEAWRHGEVGVVRALAALELREAGVRL